MFIVQENLKINPSRDQCKAFEFTLFKKIIHGKHKLIILIPIFSLHERISFFKNK